MGLVYKDGGFKDPPSKAVTGGAQWGHTGGWKILAIYIFSSIVWCCTTPVERNLAFDQK